MSDVMHVFVAGRMPGKVCKHKLAMTSFISAGHLLKNFSLMQIQPCGNQPRQHMANDNAKSIRCARCTTPLLTVFFSFVSSNWFTTQGNVSHQWRQSRHSCKSNSCLRNHQQPVSHATSNLFPKRGRAPRQATYRNGKACKQYKHSVPRMMRDHG